jgi:hypothetical protein
MRLSTLTQKVLKWSVNCDKSTTCSPLNKHETTETLEVGE